MEFGGINGLAVSGQYDQRINDLRVHEQEDARAKQIAENRAKMFADDLDYKNASNEYDAPLIKRFATDQIKKIGEYYRQNPDVMYNPEKLAALNVMKRELKDNNSLNRGLASDSAYRDYLKDLGEVAKNPGAHDAEAYQDIQRQWRNYTQFGNQDGEEAAKTQGAKSFLYTKPKDFVDLNEVHRKSGDSMNPNSIEYLNNGRDGAYRTFVADKDLTNEAALLYQQNKRQYDVQFTNKGIEPIGAIRSALIPYIKGEYHIGDKNRLGEEMALAAYKQHLKDAGDKAAAGFQVNPYRAVVMDKDYTKADPEDLAKTFGTNVPYFYYNADGKLAKGQGDDFHYDGDIFDKDFKKNAAGKVIPYQKTGVKTTPGFVYKTLDWGGENNFLKKAYGVFGDYEVKPEYKDKVEIIETPPDKSGKSEKVLKVKAFNNVNANSPDYEGKFNSRIATTKQRNEIGISGDMLEQTIYEDQAGNRFLKDASGNTIPYR